MTQEEFEFLVNTLELDAAIRPGLYKARLAALAVLGYAYVLTVVSVLLLSVAALVYIIVVKHSAAYALGKLVIGLLVLIYMVARAMWVKLEPPRGRVVKAAEFPKLFEMIEDVRRRAKAPRVSQVLITSEFNAAVVQIPRLGFFGWPKNYLILGLPLMHALHADEFKAVVAHEFGHLSGAHGHFGAWIYRLRAGWSRLFQALTEQEHWGSVLFAKFFQWYIPKFNAYSFVQARQQEYDADATSAAVTSAQAAGSALLRVDLQANFLDRKFWPALFKRTHDAPEPSIAPYTLMGQVLKKPLQPDHVQRYLDDSLRRKTGYQDTHPCLADRLKALEVAPKPTPLTGPTAAEALLGPQANVLRTEFDNQWRQDVKPWWQQRHARVNQSKSRLTELEARGDSLSVDERFEHAQIIEELSGEDIGLARYKDLLQSQPEHLGTRFAHGRLLLEKDNGDGISDIEFVMSRDASAVEAGCELIVSYLRRQGRDQDARTYIDRYWQRQEVLEKAEAERRRFKPDDTYLQHDLPADKLKELVTQIASCSSLKEAYLVRKQVRELKEQTCYGLFVLSNTSALMRSDATGARLVEEISKKLGVDADIRIVALDSNGGPYLKVLKKIPNSLIVG